MKVDRNYVCHILSVALALGLAALGLALGLELGLGVGNTKNNVMLEKLMGDFSPHPPENGRH